MGCYVVMLYRQLHLYIYIYICMYVCIYVCMPSNLIDLKHILSKICIVIGNLVSVLGGLLYSLPDNSPSSSQMFIPYSSMAI